MQLKGITQFVAFITTVAAMANQNGSKHKRAESRPIQATDYSGRPETVFGRDGFRMSEALLARGMSDCASKIRKFRCYH